MVALTFGARRRLLGGLLVWGLLGAVLGGPIVGGPRADGLLQRQQLPGTQSVVSTATALPTTTPTQASRTQAASASITRSSAPASASASTAVATTSIASARQASASASRTTMRASSVSAASASGTPTQSATTTSAAATATATIEPSIFSSSSKYFGYTIGVLVVVCVFGFVLFVLFIRFIVQLFSKKPQPPPVNTTNRGWRYSRDSDLDSAGPIPTSAHPTTQSDLGPRHKDIENSEMGERRAFLSTDSVTLYPVPKLETESERYDSDSGRGHLRSFSSSSGSGTITTPFVSRRPVSMSFLHSPPATHPAFIVDPGSQSGHSHEGDVEPLSLPQPHLLQAVPEVHTAPDTNSLLLARAGHSDAYRQQTRSSTGLSRAASTASAYSTQPPASIPPVPELPPAWMLSGRGFEPDVAEALTTMRGRNGSVDSVNVPQGTTAPPTDEGHPPMRRMMSGQAGWGRQARTSIHGDGYYFDQR